MLDKKLLATTLPNPDERAAQYRATNPAFQPFAAPPGNQPNIGWMKGALAARDLQFKQNDDVRQQGLLDIANHGDVRQERTSQQQAEAFDWKRKDRDREMAIQSGMSEAAQQGGFEGVIDYLTNADPDRALDFAAKKNSLDQAMMKTDTIKSLIPIQQAAAMAEGYGIIGKMGTALLRAPDEDRQGMYQNMLPVLKKINPDAPDSLNQDAVNMFMLGAAQAMPANLLYANDKKLNQYQSAIGQKMGDYQRIVEQYGADSPQAQILKNSIFNDSMNKGMTAAEQANLQLKQGQNNVMGENQLRQEFSKNSDNFNKVATFYQQLASAAKESMTPDGKIKGPNDLTVIYNYGHMLDPNSSVREGEYATYANTGGWPDTLRIRYNKALNGDKLSDRQREAFVEAATTIFDANKKSYDTLKSGYQDIITKRGYDPQSVLVSASPLASLDNDPAVPAELQRTAMKYVAQGMDPKVADGIVKDILAKKTQQTQQAIQQPESLVAPAPMSTANPNNPASIAQGLRDRQAQMPQPRPQQMPGGTYQPME